MLLKAYVQIIINVIFAPVLILPNVLPGNNSFMNWLKRIIGNLLTFPLTVILLITVQLIAANDEHLNFIGHSSAPVQFSLPMLPFTTSQLVPIITAVFLLVIPEMVQKVVDSIAGPSLIEAGPGALLGGIGGAAAAIYSPVAGLATISNALAGPGPLGALGRRFGFGKSIPAGAPPPSIKPESTEAPATTPSA